MKLKTPLSFSIPGKAFLAGEYLALKGGPALTAAMGPRFSLKVQAICSLANSIKNPFHPNSPAGKYWESYSHFFNNYELSFYDAHQGRGGWGGSTAEFALLYYFQEWVKDKAQSLDLKRILGEYQKIADIGGVFKPSGADLIGQMSGMLTFFNKNLDRLESFSWTFGATENPIGFLLMKTGFKLSTHEHIKMLADFDSAGLELQMQKIYQGLRQENSSQFLEGINFYALELKKLGFVALETEKLLSQLEDPDILAKKGCGALGADVVCVFFQEKKRSQVIKKIEKLGLKVVGSNLELELGVREDAI